MKKVIHWWNRETTGDWFWEHLCNIERNDEDTSKPVARHFDLPNHSKQHMTVCDLFLYLGSLESCKTLEQTFIFQISTFNPPNLFLCSCHHIPISIDPFSADKPTHNPQFLQLLWWMAKHSKQQLLNSLWWPIYVINSVDDTSTKLPCYTHLPMQHHSFFR